MTLTSTRHGIYYWKCDRPAAFHGTAQGGARHRPEVETLVREVVTRHFGHPPEILRDGGGQGNHLTYIAVVEGREYFIRLEDGPERDNYLAVESMVMERVREWGVPTPRVFATDASRRDVPFAWQILACLPEPDLNRHFKAGTLVTSAIAGELGRLMAKWQTLPVEGFGPFDVDCALREGRLRGLHDSYASYFFTRLDAHLGFLRERNFLAPGQVDAICGVIDQHRDLLALRSGCLVHKDLALWNVLGTDRTITAVIDWDDCVSGDPVDDFSLLACFHDGAFLRQAFDGYVAIRAWPPDHVRRFWLHLLRNMIFKAVIRVGAGYFDHGSDFFLVGAGASGASLREKTLSRIVAALEGLRAQKDPFSL
ncbi:MAG: aminoglycoside phosphotransferase family protein [Verrucomicrobia bacterium]|nr:aminoglycoside phosphotransferase family protein [Verrucomicrobiota bacterium]